MSDHPDYFGMPQHPKYGTFTRIGDHINTNDTIWYTVFNVEAKGKTYPGGFFVATNGVDGDYINLYVDGVSITTVAFSQLKYRGFNSGYYWPFSLAVYDTISPNFTVNIAPDLTFEISFKLRFLPKDANPRSVTYSFNYAKIV